MINNIRVGIEIECLFNNNIDDVFNFIIGSYRHGEFIPNLGWLAERDSSIYNSRKINFRSEGLELISPTIRGKKEFFNEIDRFIKYFSNNGKYKLKRVFYFNKSCGSHIHISVFRKPRYFNRLTHKKSLIRTRNDFINKIKRSSFPTSIKTQILANYNRNFSRQSWTDQERREIRYDRNYEFNFYSETCGKGIEWRSINMCGIETWEQFKEFWTIVYSCVENLVRSMVKWKDRDTYNINTKEYKKYFKPIQEEIVVEDNIMDDDDILENSYNNLVREALERRIESDLESPQVERIEDDEEEEQNV